MKIRLPQSTRTCMEESLGAVPLEALQKLTAAGASDDLGNPRLAAFGLEIVNVQCAMLSIVKLRSSVDEVHSVAQTLHRITIRLPAPFRRFVDL